MTLGDLIRDYRERNNLSLEDFAKLSKLTRPYIWMLEKNKNTKNNKPIIPSAATLKKVAVALKMPVGTLLETLDEDSPVRLKAKISITDEEREYIEKYRALSDGHREAVDGLLNLLYEQDKSTEAPKHEQLAGRVNRVIRSGDTVPVGLDILPKTIEIDIPVEDNNERAMLHRLLDEELDKEKEERRASSSGKSARGGK